MNAIILAGEQPIKNSSDTSNKALLRINGKMMVEYVVEAVAKVDEIEKIIVIGPKKDLEKHLSGKVDTVIDPVGSIMDNLLTGIRYIGYNEHVLVCTSDVPMITPEAISDFIVKSKGLKADLCYPIVEKKVNDCKFPDMERSYVRMKEGAFTGGNIFYINPCVVEQWFSLAVKLLKFRKNPLKMARLLNFNFMIQLLMGTLSISKVEKKVSNMMNIKANAIISEYPEIGSDVDKPDDIVIASYYLSK